MTIRRVVLARTALAVAAVLTAAACTSGGGPSEPSGTASGPSGHGPSVVPSTGPAPTELPVALVDFASYTAVPLTDPDSPRYPGPTTPTSLSDVTVASAVRTALAQLGGGAALTEQGSWWYRPTCASCTTATPRAATAVGRCT